MGAEANFRIITDDESKIVIRDIGPWNKHLTITNDADRVVAKIWPRLAGRRLFYIDSEDNMDELVVDHQNGAFIDFKPGPGRKP